jgi:ionotropic glutamate receptor NMDA 3A
MDILQEKWYGGLPCFKLATEIAQPQPLGVAAVTGQYSNLNLMFNLHPANVENIMSS